MRGKAVQVDPIKPTLKAPVTKRLKLHYDKPLSTFAFKFNLRRYSVVDAAAGGAAVVGAGVGVAGRGLGITLVHFSPQRTS